MAIVFSTNRIKETSVNTVSNVIITTKSEYDTHKIKICLLSSYLQEASLTIGFADYNSISTLPKCRCYSL
jgi:hypothetical protein